MAFGPLNDPLKAYRNGAVRYRIGALTVSKKPGPAKPAVWSFLEGEPKDLTTEQITAAYFGV